MRRKPWCSRYSGALGLITRPNFGSSVRRSEILERDNATVYESNCLVRNRDGRWDVGIIEGIVERVAEEDKVTPMMKTPDPGAEPKPRAPVRTVTVVRIIS